MKINLGLLTILLLLSLFTITSCKDDTNNIGSELLNQDKIEISHVKGNVASYMKSNEALRNFDPNVGLVGTWETEKFGKTNSSFAFQVRIPTSFDQAQVDKNIEIDSVALALTTEYNTKTFLDSIPRLSTYDPSSSNNTPFPFYGKDLFAAKKKLNLYLLTKDIPFDKEGGYNTDIDFSSFYESTPIASAEYTPKKHVSGDTVSFTGGVRFVIPVDKLPYLSTFLKKPDVTQQEFLNNFKGFYVKAEDSDGIIPFRLLAEGSYKGSYFTFRFKYNSKTKEDKDTIVQGNFPMYITNYSTRFNLYEHDYTSATFKDSYNDDVEDELMYLRTNRTTKVVLIPKIDGKTIPEWAKSQFDVIKEKKLERIINKALITIPVESYNPDQTTEKQPQVVYLYGYNKKGERKIIVW